MHCGCHNGSHASDSEEDKVVSNTTSSTVQQHQQQRQHQQQQHQYKQSRRGIIYTAISILTRCKRPSPEFNMPQVERTMKAAILIQRWYRRYLARMEVRRRYTWTIFQSIEYAGEQDQVKLYNFFNALLTHMPGSKPESLPASTNSSTDKVHQLVDSMEPTYKGIHISDPLTRTDLDNLIDTFQRKKYHRLHVKYVSSILAQATNILKTLPNLNPASVAISKQVTVIGDLHGKLDDLLVIFHKNGLPSPENPYIFNGDFVDRGKKGLEVLLILLSSLIVFPGGVFLNRGNHEDHVMNTRYGFIKEVRNKYKTHADKVLSLIEGVYRWLPLGSLVNNKVLIVHGGISDITDLEWLKTLDRQKYVSLLRPPLTVTPNPGSELIDKLEWKQVFDILWSDPQAVDGCVPNALRGAGTYFGPDVTDKFLKKFNLLYLIRSHECKLGGYEVIHSNKVITIFSASNYYEVGSNKGAYVKLVGQELTPHFVQFNSIGTRTKRLTFRQRVGLVESSAIRELGFKINSSKEQLMQAFKLADSANRGLITIGEWCNAMEEVTALNLPWRMLREKLVTTDKNSNCVEYLSTFQEYSPGKKNSGGMTVAETLYRNKSSLEAIFKIIDKDNSGHISREEFSEACNLLSEHLSDPIPKENFMDICKSMDYNHDGLVDLNEFLETFRLVDQNKDGTVDESSSEEEK